MNRRLLLTIAAIAAAGLTGCAGTLEQRVQLFKAYGPGQVDQRYLGLHLVTVSQTETPPLPK